MREPWLGNRSGLFYTRVDVRCLCVYAYDMRKFEVTTHEDDQVVEADVFKIEYDGDNKPVLVRFMRHVPETENPRRYKTSAMFNMASVVSVIDISDRPQPSCDDNPHERNMFVRRINYNPRRVRHDGTS